MKPVLLLTLDFPPTCIGGISAWASDLADALHNAGHVVTVIARKNGDTREHDHAKPYRIIRAAGRSWARWQGVWMRLASSRHIHKDTLVIAATWPLVTRTLPAIRRRHATLAVAFHGSEITTLQDGPKALLTVMDAADYLLPVSHFLRTELIRLGCTTHDSRIRVLPMPLSVEHRQNEQPRTNLICVARPTRRKGIDRAINIAHMMGETLHLVGPVTGPPGTVAHGPLPREKTLEMMQSAKAIILTPTTNEDGFGEEGLGLVLLEAAARGVPAIGCNTGGVPEAVGPGLVLRDPENPNIEEIRNWIQDPQNGKKALEWVQESHGPRQCLHVLREVLS